MEHTRSIRKILKAQKVNMGGIFLDQALPLREADQIDPILLIHHWSDTLKGGKQQHQVGVGPHPHRGFTPVTFIFKGAVHHRDSTGEDEVVYEGGTQWMDSGSGIVHSERPPKELAENGGDFEIIQFWVNTPSDKKMLPPSYQPLSKKDTPELIEADGKANTMIVAGDYKGKKGPILTQTDLLLLRFTFDQDGKADVPIPEHFNALLYVLEGEFHVNGNDILDTKKMAWFNNDGKGITLKANAGSKAILLAGKPINEPVASYGPFVMNTQQEIMQAMEDYQSGKMGRLVENFN